MDSAVENIVGNTTLDPAVLPVKTSNSYSRIIIATFIVNLNTIAFGAGVAYTSPALPDINSISNVDGPFHLTSEECSWVGGVYPLGALIGGLVGSYFIEKRGRKLTLVHAAIFNIFGWLIMALAWSITALYVGRFCTGYCSGMLQISANVYIAEVTPAKLRGMFTSCFALCLAIGILLMNIMGCFFHWRWLSMSCVVLLAVHFCLLLFIPETPRYLLNHGRRDHALKSFLWFQPSGDQKDFLQLEEDLITCRDRNALEQTVSTVVQKKSQYVPMMFTAGLYVAQIMTGIDYVWFYTVTIFQDSGVDFAIDSNGEAVLTSFVCVLGSILASFLFDRAGRRVLLIVSGSVTALCMFILGLEYKLKQFDATITDRFAALPVTLLMAFQLFYAIGWSAGPGVVFSEIIPKKNRGLGSAFTGVCCWTAVFIVSKFGVTFATAVGQYSLFWLFSGTSIIGVLFVFFLLPETKGKTLEEIEKIFT